MSVIFSYHMSLKLNVYDQAQQKSKFWAKNMFWPKMAICIALKFFKSSSADPTHRVCHFEVSYALLSYHIALYLNVYGQAQQKSKFWAKNIMFGTKWIFLLAQKILKVVQQIGLIECIILRYHTPL